MTETPYFEAFEGRTPPWFAPFSQRRRGVWHFLAGCTVAAGALYLHWRWTTSLNMEALWYSVLVAGAETMFYLGTLLFYFDIWEEGDTPSRPAPRWQADVRPDGAKTPLSVDIFVTTYDEPVSVVAPTIVDAKAVGIPANLRVQIWLLDDGDRPEMAALAEAQGVGYLARCDNQGFKAGNLRNGLLHTSGDFVVICDADTRLFAGFLQNTLGYFRDPKVAWVQTPHWFYDIPEGEHWRDWIMRRLKSSPDSRLARWGAGLMTVVTGQQQVGSDPYLSDPTVFFDVIQRRRNRNGASFCCGAASIHRREVIFAGALKRKTASVAKLHGGVAQGVPSCLTALPLQPYRFHVSEDLYTSILLHEEAGAGWQSVYHPQVEARMLSPMSLKAWAAQRLKYAGGTFDIALHDNPLCRRGLNWRQKLHYGATFWSYFSIFWVLILLLAPVISLISGVPPVAAYSAEFFAYFLPAVVLGELAMMAACKGHALGPGRVMALATLPVHWCALSCVLRGQRPEFAPTPKVPMGTGGLRYVAPHLVLLGVMACAAGIGVTRTALGHSGFSTALLWVNLFWLLFNMALIARILPAAAWTVPGRPASQSRHNIWEVQQDAGQFSA